MKQRSGSERSSVMRTWKMRCSSALVAGSALVNLFGQAAGFALPAGALRSTTAYGSAVGQASGSAKRSRSVSAPLPRRSIDEQQLQRRRPGTRRADHILYGRRRSRRDDFYDEDEMFYDEDDDFRDERTWPGYEAEERGNRVPFLPSTLSKALIAGVFVLGIGTGVTVDSAINTDPRDLASRDAIDRNAPNPNICQTYGSSAMVVDQRVFVTFNPFSLHVTQADTKPGCVLRPANVVEVLQRKRGLLTTEEVETCKGGMNTWGFVGDLNDNPQLSCVYQSDDAQNEFLSNPKYGLGEDVYDDDRAAAARKSAGSEPANGPRIMSNTVRSTIVTDRPSL